MHVHFILDISPAFIAPAIKHKLLECNGCTNLTCFGPAKAPITGNQVVIMQTPG